MKTVVITGSAKGFGFNLAKCFRAYNYNVVLSDLFEESLAKAKTLLQKEKGDGKILTVVADVTNYDNMQNLWNSAVKEFKTVDVWINNAGVNQPDKAVYELEQKQIDMVLNVDLKGTIYGSKIAFSGMKTQGFGQIFNVEGYGSNDAMMLGLSIYGTSKRAITYFTQALAKESKTLKANVIVGRITPGIMITDFITSAVNQKGTITLSEKTKKVYNILGDYPETIATFMVDRIVKNTKNNAKFTWLTGFRAFSRFLTAGFKKRDFFKQ